MGRFSFGLMLTSALTKPSVLVVVPESAYTLTNTITYFGETLTLSTNMKVGYSLNGQPFIVTDTAGSWSSSSTPSATINEYIGNGAMFDPRIVTGAYTQGFDAMLANGNLGTGNLGASGSIPYGLNIDPAVGGAYNLAGKVGRIAKSVRVSGGGLGEFCLPQKILHINLVPTVPPAGAICPIYDGLGGVTWMTTANTSKNIFAGDGYISGEESLATCIANDYLPSDTDWPAYIDNGEMRRGLVPRRSWWGTSGYSRDFGGVWNKLLNACHAEGSSAVPDALFYRILTMGALNLENVLRGNPGRGGAGQNSGIKPMAVAAGMASRLVEHYLLAQLHEGSETHQAFWPTSAFNNIAVGFPNGSGGGFYQRQPFLAEHYGRAAFFHGDQDVAAVNPAVGTDLYDSDVAPRYQHTSWSAAGLGLANCLRFINGQAGKTGVNLVLHDAAISSSNLYSACIPAMWRYTAFNDNMDGYLSAFNTTAERTRTRQTIAAAAGSIPMTPDPVSPMRNQATYLYATATGFGWNYSTWDVGGPIKAITRVDHRSTLDGGCTFYSENNVGEVNTKPSDVPYNIDIGIQNRRWSADGAGPWSVNYAKVQPGAGVYANSQLPRFVIRPTGTASGSPTNIQAPQIVIKPLSAWAGPYYENLAAPAAQNLVLYAGVGYWTGDCAGGITYQWYAGALADGSDKAAISGATASTFVVTSAQAGNYLTLGVTIGGVTAFSTQYAAAATVYPAMSLTAFDGTNDYLDKTTAFSGIVNNRKFTWSVTGALTGGDGVAKRFVAFGDAAGTASTDNIIIVDRLATNAIQVIIKNTAGTTFFTGITTTNAWRTTDSEVTLTVSIDMDAGRYQVCINNTVLAWATGPTVTPTDIPYASIIRPRLFTALSGLGTTTVPINLRCVFFHNDSLDLSVTANQNKMKPANIGNRGEGVFGVDAILMTYGPAASSGTNYGTGGNYTVVGTVTDVP